MTIDTGLLLGHHIDVIRSFCETGHLRKSASVLHSLRNAHFAHCPISLLISCCGQFHRMSV